MKIVFVEFPPSGGLFQFSVQLAEALARRGHQVQVLTGPSPELSSREPDLRIRSVLSTWHPTAGADAPSWWRKARRGVRAGQHHLAWAQLLGQVARLKPDVVLWSTWRFPVDGWGVQAMRRLLPDATLAIIAHEPRPLVEQPGADGLYKDSGVTYSALAGAYRSVNVAFTLGESARDVLRSTWRDAPQVHVIPHGDEGVFAQTEVPPVGSTGPVALAFGTVTAYKGIDDLLAVWPAVRDQVPDARLVLAGSIGADVDAQALRDQVESTPGVELHAGYVELSEVAGYFGRARVVVLPYKRSSQSGVAHLAHTFGRPVIATRVGDIPAVVVDDVTGLLVDPGDAQGLTDAVIRALNSADDAARWGQAGADALASGASWDEVADRVEAGLTSVRRPSGLPRAGRRDSSEGPPTRR